MKKEEVLDFNNYVSLNYDELTKKIKELEEKRNNEYLSIRKKALDKEISYLAWQHSLSGVLFDVYFHVISDLHMMGFAHEFENATYNKGLFGSLIGMSAILSVVSILDIFRRHKAEKDKIYRKLDTVYEIKDNNVELLIKEKNLDKKLKQYDELINDLYMLRNRKKETITR